LWKRTTTHLCKPLVREQSSGSQRSLIPNEVQSANNCLCSNADRSPRSETGFYIADAGEGANTSIFAHKAHWPLPTHPHPQVQSHIPRNIDLLDFPTIIFYESGYSLHTLRQASRRSWRIGQRRPVRVKFFAMKGGDRNWFTWQPEHLKPQPETLKLGNLFMPAWLQTPAPAVQ
jgi:hypothetical protein